MFLKCSKWFVRKTGAQLLVRTSNRSINNDRIKRTCEDFSLENHLDSVLQKLKYSDSNLAYSLIIRSRFIYLCDTIFSNC